MPGYAHPCLRRGRPERRPRAAVAPASRLQDEAHCALCSVGDALTRAQLAVCWGVECHHDDHDLLPRRCYEAACEALENGGAARNSEPQRVRGRGDPNRLLVPAARKLPPSNHASFARGATTGLTPPLSRKRGGQPGGGVSLRNVVASLRRDARKAPASCALP